MNKHSDEPVLITPEEIEAAGGPSKAYQGKLRMQPGRWLPYVMIGGEKSGKVRYWRADWYAYLKSRTRRHTRDGGKPDAA